MNRHPNNHQTAATASTVVVGGGALQRRDMLFCILFVGDERLIRDMVRHSARELCAEGGWVDEEGVLGRASLTKLRVMFFLLLDRDIRLKAKVVEGWPEVSIPGVERRKAESFFLSLGKDIILPWLIDERRTADQLLSDITDLYLVS